MDDRLYLVEEKDEDEDVDGELVNPQQGRRIFATSLQGDTLQVYTSPVEGHTFKYLCYFRLTVGCYRLLAPVQDVAVGQSEYVVG